MNEEADAVGAAARAEVEAVAAQLADARRKLDNLYRAIEDGGIDLPILAPRIREVKANVDALTANHARLATAATPVVRLADAATIARYVERLRAILATGSPNAQRAFLRAWIASIDTDGMKLTVTFTLPADLGGSAATGGGSSANPGENSGLTKVLPRVANGGGGGSRAQYANGASGGSWLLYRGFRGEAGAARYDGRGLRGVARLLGGPSEEVKASVLAGGQPVTIRGALEAVASFV